jgi:hypothetical protein
VPDQNPIGAPGFEPGTSCSQSRRATGLRYAPRWDNIVLGRRLRKDTRIPRTNIGTPVHAERPTRPVSYSGPNRSISEDVARKPSAVKLSLFNPPEKKKSPRS